MNDIDRLKTVLDDLLSSRSLDSVLDLVQQANALGRKAIVPVCVGFARIAASRLYEQHGYRSFAHFTSDRWGMPDSTAGYFRRLGEVIIKFHWFIEEWLSDPKSDPGKITFLPQAIENHGESPEVLENLNNLSVREFQAWADSDPDLEFAEALPQRVDLESFRQIRKRLTSKGHNISVLNRCYSVEEQESFVSLDTSGMTEDDAQEVYDLLKQSKILALRSSVRIAPHVGRDNFQRMLDVAGGDEVDLLRRSYRAQAYDAVRHLAPLILREDKERLEAIAVRAGVRNKAVTAFDPVFQVESEANFRHKPLISISTNLD
jgi:hypothetical protein